MRQAVTDRTALILRLSDAIRPLNDPDAIKKMAARILGRHLDVAHASYAELLPDGASMSTTDGYLGPGVSSIAGTYPAANFGSFFRDLENLGVAVAEDTRADPSVVDFEATWGQIGARAGIASPLVKDGRFVAALYVLSETPRKWREDEIALVTEFAERTWEAVERARLEQRLQDSEERHRTLVQSIEEGVCLLERVRAGPDGPRDYRVLMINPALAEMFPARDLVGQLLGERRPDVAERWFEVFDDVLETGTSFRAVHHPHDSGLVVDVTATRIGGADDAQIFVSIRDVTELWTAQETVRTAAERQEYLLRLSDALRPVEDPGKQREIACRLLGQQLGTDRVLYVEFDAAADAAIISGDYRRGDLPSLAGSYPGATFRGAFDKAGAGRTWVVRDAATDAGIPRSGREVYLALGMTSWIDVPSLKDGRIESLFSAVSSTPRDWTEDETALVEETAERLWSAIQRGRTETALRESEERFRQFAEASSDILWIRNAETLAMEYLSPAFDEIFGVSRKEALDREGVEDVIQLLLDEDHDRTIAALKSLRNEDGRYDYRVRRASDGEIRCLRTTGFGLTGPDGTITRLGGITRDRTDEMQAAHRTESLVSELQHRTRNLVGVVRAICSRTLKRSGSLADFRRLFDRQLDALSRVNGLLSQLEPGRRITFDALLSTEMAAFGLSPGDNEGSGLKLSGPDGIELRSATVQTLALTLHELLNCAILHGAFSNPGGQLAVAWELTGGRLAVEWRERWSGDGGGDERGGYCRELVERALPYQLGADTTYDLAHAELSCTLVLPISSRGEGSPDAAPSH